ncbi:MAG: deoxyribose-phosphate aldolase, partial [Cyanobacteria bacterium HKST-UBA05]|nr:deoxyribose-phosphate aldolase [Cyanobacteria bacterium HKST-UBA05]
HVVWLGVSSVDGDNDPMDAMNTMNTMTLAACLDATKLTFSDDEDGYEVIKQLCADAVEYGYRAVCVPPDYVGLARSFLTEFNEGHPQPGPLIATVIGFPFDKRTLENEQQQPSVGKVPVAEKIATIEQVLMVNGQKGADELDVVMNVADFKATQALDELDALKNAAGLTPIKLIIEVDLLRNEEISWVTHLCCEAGIAFVKTSTGMVAGGQGATRQVVMQIRDAIDSYPRMVKPGIKASGGIKTAEQAQALLDAGASVLGTSSPKALLGLEYSSTSSTTASAY